MDALKRVLKFMAAAVGGATTLGFLRYLVFLILYKRKQMRSKNPLPPGPTPLPVLGSLLDVAKYTGPDGNPLVHIALMEMGKNYDGLFALYLGASYTVVITKPSVAEEAFSEHVLDDGTPGKGLLTMDRAMNQSHGGDHVPSMYAMTRNGKGIAMSNGNYWRKVRGRLVAHMTNYKVASKNAPMIMEEVNSVCWSWRERAKQGQDITDLTLQLKRESMNMAMRLLFSQRFGAEVSEDCREIQECVGFFFQNLSSGNPSDMIPALRVLPNEFLNQCNVMAARRDRVLERLIDNHRKSFMELKAQGKMNSPADARDMVDLFLFDEIEGFEIVVDGVTKHEKLTRDQVVICLWDIIFASTDTTASTNEWLIYHMVNEPEVQRKVHEELDRVVGPNNLPTMEHRDSLPYFWAVIKEVMRIRLISPVMAPHYASEDLTLRDAKGKPHFIPRGATIFMHGYSMGLDPEFWDNPEKFDPDRWLNDPRNEGLDFYGQVRRKSTDHYKFMPFSVGPRMCPGYAFARVAQFLQSATIMHCFNMQLSKKGLQEVKGGKLDMTETWGLTIMPQRYGEKGYVSMIPRPAANNCAPLYNDVDRTKPFLNRTEQRVALLSKTPLSVDTAILRFRLAPTADAPKDGTLGPILGLPVGKHVKLIMPNLNGVEQGKWNGRDDPEAGRAVVERAYTPTSSDDNPGIIDLLVKFYAPGVVARFPDGGKVSQQLSRLQIGQTITIKGPFGLIEYVGKGVFKEGKNTSTKTMVGMMAGGSGITPMLQILEAALKDAEDTTRFSLLYANQTPEDILCRPELEALAKNHPNRFKLHFTVDRVPAGTKWEYSVGFIDAVMIAEHMPPAKNSSTAILMCGPLPMVEHACKANLLKLGYDKDCMMVF